MSVGVLDVHQGWLSPSNRAAASRDAPLASPPDDAAFALGLASLTKRERQILRLRAKGLTIAEICDRYFLSENTVKKHLHGAFRKLALGGLRQQARIARACYLLGRYDARRRDGKTARRRVGSRESGGGQSR